MKKLLALLLLTAMCLLVLVGCGDGTPQGGDAGVQAGTGDLAYVKEKGTLVVGVTEFEPMDYQDADGNWTGFDADMAVAFAESLGVSAEFRVIEWDSKVKELEDKTIDVVWNGMTLNDEVKASMETSKPYFNNAQMVIVRAENASRYKITESIAGASFVVESGSAGQEQADANGFTYTEVADQAAALQQVSSGAADAAIIDFLMAKSMIGLGTDYADLTYTVGLSSEEYVVGFRKGSDLAAALNEFFAASYADGSMQTVARNYGINAFLLAQ